MGVRRRFSKSQRAPLLILIYEGKQGGTKTVLARCAWRLKRRKTRYSILAIDPGLPPFCSPDQAHPTPFISTCVGALLVVVVPPLSLRITVVAAVSCRGRVLFRWYSAQFEGLTHLRVFRWVVARSPLQTASFAPPTVCRPSDQSLADTAQIDRSSIVLATSGSSISTSTFPLSRSYCTRRTSPASL